MTKPKDTNPDSDSLRCSVATPVGVVPCKVGTQPWLVVVNRRRKTIKVGDVILIREAGVGHKWIRVRVENLEPLRVSR